MPDRRIEEVIFSISNDPQTSTSPQTGVWEPLLYMIPTSKYVNFLAGICASEAAVEKALCF